MLLGMTSANSKFCDIFSGFHRCNPPLSHFQCPKICYKAVTHFRPVFQGVKKWKIGIENLIKALKSSAKKICLEYFRYAEVGDVRGRFSRSRNF